MPKAATTSEWFTVDKQGLSDLRENADPAGLLYELYQNVADEDGATTCALTLTPAPTRGRYVLTVTDDVPGGFLNIKDAYRLFAKSYKREHAEKRGRFNVGEKLVLALADSAMVKSTGGTILFNADGTRTETSDHTTVGSVISATVKLSAKGAEQAIAGFKRVIPPANLTVTLNGVELPHLEPDMTTDVKALPTMLQGDEGWRTTQRNTTLSLYEAIRFGSPQAYIYEMGIPIVEIDGRYSVSVGQKVPLTLDRDNVPPAYLRRIYSEVANAAAAAQVIVPEDTTTTWAKEALEDERTSPEAVRAIIVGRFGEKAVAYDPSDKEGSVIAAQRGFTVIGGRTLSAAAWEKVREKTPDLLRPAGQVTPSNNTVELSANGKDALDPSKWTPAMKAVAAYSIAIAQRIGLATPTVHMNSEMTADWMAAYSPGSLRFNYGRIGKAWFDVTSEHDVLSLLIHEFTHDRTISPNGWDNHQSEDYHRGLTGLGATLALMGMDSPLPRLADFRKAN